MKLTIEELKNTEPWHRAGVSLPDYDVNVVRTNAKTTPVWLHFGIGNIFRIFIGSIADRLMAEGSLTSGLI